MSIPSTSEITILPETTDPRPEPPKMPDIWVVRSFEWGDIQQKWHPVIFAHYPSEQKAQEGAHRRIAQGDRRVQVIKIGGDA